MKMSKPVQRKITVYVNTEKEIFIKNERSSAAPSKVAQCKQYTSLNNYRPHYVSSFPPVGARECGGDGGCPFRTGGRRGWAGGWLWSEGSRQMQNSSEVAGAVAFQCSPGDYGAGNRYYTAMKSDLPTSLVRFCEENIIKILELWW